MQWVEVCYEFGEVAKRCFNNVNLSISWFVVKGLTLTLACTIKVTMHWVMVTEAAFTLGGRTVVTFCG